MNENLHPVEYYKELIYRYVKNELTREEQKMLTDWIDLSPENKNVFLETRHIVELSVLSGIRGKFAADKKDIWNKISGEIQESSAETENVRTLAPFLKIAGVAASFLLVFLIGMLVSKWVFTQGGKAALANHFVHEVIVPNGGKSQLILPDGTEVWLNAGTTFHYDGSYGLKERNVYLEGEAYFHVKTNRKMPFVVQTSDLKIKATGTSFNVKAYKDEKYISTTLDEGIVKIEGKGVNLSMKPKQNITYIKRLSKDNGSAKTNISREPDQSGEQEKPIIKTASNVNTELFTSWKDNKWIIESEDLKDIATILERKFNVIIHIESPELLKYKFSGTFSQETLEQILDVIRLTAPLNYNIKDGVVNIRIAGNRKANYNEIIN